MSNKTNFPKVWYEDDGILRIRYASRQPVTFDAVMESHEKHTAICHCKKPILVMGEHKLYVEFEAARFAASCEVESVVSAVAVMATSPLEKTLSELFLKFHKLPYPIKFFDSVDVAEEWLSQFVKDSCEHMRSKVAA